MPMSYTVIENMRGSEPQTRSQQHYLSDFFLSSHTLGIFFLTLLRVFCLPCYLAA